MKKALLCFMVTLLTIWQSFALDFTDGDFLYTVTGTNTVEVSDYGGSGNVTIPSTVSYNDVTYNVVGIGNRAFEWNSDVTNITIPNGVTYIGNYAFQDCYRLTGVTIPSNVTYIGNYAFQNCTSLTSITIPNSITIIGDYAFSGCTGLTNATIQNGVTNIGNYMFSNCTGLTNITIPGSVTSIGNYAFYGCTSLANATIPGSVTSIGDYAFSGCTGLTNATIQNGVTNIGNNMFSGCTGLTNVTFPNSLTTIGSSAFEGCTGLTSITIPTRVTSIGKDAFANCSNLKTLYYNAINCNVATTQCNAYYCYCSWTGLQTLVIGDSVQTIPAYAFSQCTGLTNVTIPNSVTTIGSGAFNGCAALENVSISKSVIEIQASTFSGCSALKTIVIPNSVTQIGYSAFNNCRNATYIELGSNVYNLGDNAFSNCINIQSIRSKCEYPPTLATNTFANTPKVRPLYIPCNTLSRYQSAEYWSDFQNIVEDSCGFRITATSADETMGLVYGEGNYLSGETAILSAVPLSGYHFDSWNDGVTDNPRYVIVTCDSNFVATFLPGTAVDNVSGESHTIYASNGQIVISGAEYESVRVCDMMGRIIFAGEATSDKQVVTVPASGIYFVQVGNNRAERVAIMQ